MKRPLWKSQDDEVISTWITAIINNASDKLTQGEANFIEHVDCKFASCVKLSQIEEEGLEKIYNYYIKDKVK